MNSDQIISIELEKIETNPHQPRKIFQDEAILELAESIEANGLIQPIVVRKKSEQQYEIIAGERRFRAHQILGRTTIPAIVKSVDEKESSILALIENIQREDLNFIEVGRAYQELLNHYKMTQEELSAIVGKGQSTIANKIRILSLPDSVIQEIIDHNLTERHARVFLKIADEKVLHKSVKYVIEHNLNVSKTEQYVARVLDKAKESKNKKSETTKNTTKGYIKDIRLFTNTIRQAVEMVNQAGVEARYSINEAEDRYTITIDVPIERSI